MISCLFIFLKSLFCLIGLLQTRTLPNICLLLLKVICSRQIFCVYYLCPIRIIFRDRQSADRQSTDRQTDRQTKSLFVINVTRFNTCRTLSYFLLVCNTCHTFINSHFVIPVTTYNNYLEIRENSLFATLRKKVFQKGPKRVGEVFLSHVVIKPVIIKNLDII